MLLHLNHEILTSLLNRSLPKCTNVCSVEGSQRGSSHWGCIQRGAWPAAISHHCFPAEQRSSFIHILPELFHSTVYFPDLWRQF